MKHETVAFSNSQQYNIKHRYEIGFIYQYLMQKLTENNYF